MSDRSRTRRGLEGALIRFFCWALLLVGAAPAFLRAEDALPPRPRIAVDPRSFDFGTVSQGTVVEHDFIVRNTGTADLNLQRVVAACGCTATTSSTAPIPPGGEAPVHVKLDTAGFSGAKEKTVRIFSNDPDEPALMVALKGTIQPEVTLEPSHLSFGDVSRSDSEARSREVTVVVREGSGVTIQSVRAVSRAIRVDELESSPTRRRLKVSLAEELPIGEVRDRVVVNLAGGRNPAVNIPVFASVKGDLRLRPATISFGIVEGEKPIVRSVRVENTGQEPVTIKEVRSSDPVINTAVRTLRPGRNYAIDVTVDPAAVERDIRALLTIVTDRPEDTTLSLSVYGILPPHRQ